MFNEEIELLDKLIVAAEELRDVVYEKHSKCITKLIELKRSKEQDQSDAIDEIYDSQNPEGGAA